MLLGTLYGKKPKKFEATFDKLGFRTNHLGEKWITACLSNVTYRGITYADHTWLKDASYLTPLGAPTQGDRIAFKAEVDMFPRGSYEVDFHLVRLTDVKKVKVKREKKS